MKVAAPLTWAGLAAIVVSAFVFGAHTAYPGSLVAVPVVGAAVVIGAGVVVPRYGTESILGLAPSRWLGKRSYSLYLVHWPILVIVVYAADRSELPVGERLGLVAVSVLVAMGMFRLVENPIRHWRLPARASVLGGGALVVGTLLILTVAIQFNQHGPYDPPVSPAATSAVVERQVTAAAAITHLPTNLEAPISQAASDWGGAFMPDSCGAGAGSSARICPEGDPKSNRRMVVYGDSHAEMWFPAFEAIAKAAHLKLIVLAKDYCPAEPLPIAENPNVSKSGQVDSACTAWHTWASKAIHRLKPALLVVTQEALYSPPGNRNQDLYSSAAWQRGVEAMFDSLAMPGTKEVLLGNTPVMGHQGPVCLEAHPDDVQACSTPARTAVLATNRVEQATAAQHGVAYIDPTPWFCSSVCPAVIGHYNVYIDGVHISATYARYLEQVLGDALGFRLGSIPIVTAPIIPGAEPWSAAGRLPRRPRAARVHRQPPVHATPGRGPGRGRLHRRPPPAARATAPSVEDMVPTRWEDWSAAAEAAYQALAARCDRVAVVGLSMGGTLACWLAERHPEIAGIAVVNPLVDPPDAGVPRR